MTVSEVATEEEEEQEQEEKESAECKPKNKNAQSDPEKLPNHQSSQNPHLKFRAILSMCVSLLCRKHSCAHVRGI